MPNRIKIITVIILLVCLSGCSNTKSPSNEDSNNDNSIVENNTIDEIAHETTTEESSEDTIEINKSKEFFLGTWIDENGGVISIVETSDPLHYDVMRNWNSYDTKIEDIIKCRLLLPGEEEYEKAWGGQNDLGIGILKYETIQRTENGETKELTFEKNAVLGYFCFDSEEVILEEGQTSRWYYSRVKE